MISTYVCFLSIDILTVIIFRKLNKTFWNSALFLINCRFQERFYEFPTLELLIKGKIYFSFWNAVLFAANFKNFSQFFQFIRIKAAICKITGISGKFALFYCWLIACFVWFHLGCFLSNFQNKLSRKLFLKAGSN